MIQREPALQDERAVLARELNEVGSLIDHCREELRSQMNLRELFRPIGETYTGEDGQAMAEHVMIASAIAVVVAIAVFALGTSVNSLWSSLTDLF